MPNKKGDYYTTAMIANFFLVEAQGKKKYNMTPLKLTKLVCLAYFWNLCLYDGEELFAELIIAGKHGFIINSILGRFAEYEDKIIPRGELLGDFNENTQHTKWLCVEKDNDIAGMLSAIFNKYASISGRELQYQDRTWDKFTNYGTKNISKPILTNSYKMLMLEQYLPPIKEFVKHKKKQEIEKEKIEKEKIEKKELDDGELIQLCIAIFGVIIIGGIMILLFKNQ